MKTKLLMAGISALIAINSTTAADLYVAGFGGANQLKASAVTAQNKKITTSEKSTTIGGLVGLGLGNYFAIEGGYANLGSFDGVNKNKVKLSQSFVDFVVKIPSSSLTPFAKVGYGRTSIDGEGPDNDLRFGVGFTTPINNKADIRVDFSRNIHYESSINITHQGLNIGLQYKL